MSIQLIAILFLIVLAVGWFYVKARKKSSASTKREYSKYPGASIEPDYSTSCCDAVKGLANKRFLAADAPKLPLADCDIQQCHCHYVRYKDRRAEDDRRTLYAARVVGTNFKERRHSSGRRATDMEGQSIG